MARTSALKLLAAVFLGFSTFACSHPAEKALQGRWNGQSVENFDKEAIAAATGWARGTSFEFEGRRLTVTVPSEKPRNGVYSLKSIEDRQITLSVLDHQGDVTELDLIVDDADSLRWVLDDGRTLVMKHQE